MHETNLYHWYWINQKESNKQLIFKVCISILQKQKISWTESGVMIWFIFRCPNAFYSYDSQLSNRKTSFGYGKKFDFSQIISVSPPSTKYESKSFLDESKKKGKSFGLGRDYSPDRSYLMPQLHKNPGPGKVILNLFQYDN